MHATGWRIFEKLIQSHPTWDRSRATNLQKCAAAAIGARIEEKSQEAPAQGAQGSMNTLRSSLGRLVFNWRTNNFVCRNSSDSALLQIKLDLIFSQSVITFGACQQL
jgi:hypothetical protein